ncbi:hypothetical protein [Flavobacterium hungaricum]|uniref:Natural product n=1 Tax=Flavobacterium hungaricum TaxID=2082725 RepID=A0ABR9TGW0_9FLAO|nr:hypothetical protein [Flavobacterium hungaricum]MBE8724575.1 hypothetical protein [Flavobacterium hungaricum]
MKIKKTKKTEKETKKFDLEKMTFAELNNMRLIVGGGGNDDPSTGTATSSNCNAKSAACGGVDNQ